MAEGKWAVVSEYVKGKTLVPMMPEKADQPGCASIPAKDNANEQDPLLSRINVVDDQ